MMWLSSTRTHVCLSLAMALTLVASEPARAAVIDQDLQAWISDFKSRQQHMFRLNLHELIAHQASAQGIPPLFLAATLKIESDFNACAVSRNQQGQPVARGIAQFTPATANAYKLIDPFDPRQSVRASATLLGDLWRQNQGRYLLAAASYNAGPDVVDTPFQDWPQETQRYVHKMRDLVRSHRDDWRAFTPTHVYHLSAAQCAQSRTRQ